MTAAEQPTHIAIEDLPIDLMQDIRRWKVWQVTQPTARYVINGRTWRRVTREVGELVDAGLAELCDHGEKYPPYHLTPAGDAALASALAQAAALEGGDSR